MFTELRECLSSLLQMRLETGQWVDSEGQTGLLKTLEALSCFSSLAYYYDRLRPLDRSFELIRMPEKVLHEDVEFILKEIDQRGYTPSPYLDEDFQKLKLPYEKGKTDFTDTASFVATTFLDILEYYHLGYQKECPYEKELEKGVQDAVDWLIEEAYIEDDQAFWSWGHKEYSQGIPSVYFTWSATVALSYACQNEHSPISNNKIETIQELLRRVTCWIKNVIQPDNRFKEQERYIVEYPQIGDAESGRVEALLIYVAGILDWATQVEIEVPQPLILNVLRTLLDIYATDQMWRLEGGSHNIIIPSILNPQGSTTLIEYEDRSYEYLLLTSASWFFMMHQERKISLEREESELLGRLLESLREKLLRDRDPLKKVWKAEGYLLYLTQRAVEAMTAWLRYVQPYRGTELSLKEIIKMAVDEALEEFQPILLEKIHKNILLLQETKGGGAT